MNPDEPTYLTYPIHLPYLPTGFPAYLPTLHRAHRTDLEPPDVLGLRHEDVAGGAGDESGQDGGGDELHEGAHAEEGHAAEDQLLWLGCVRGGGGVRSEDQLFGLLEGGGVVW